MKLFSKPTKIIAEAIALIAIGLLFHACINIQDFGAGKESAPTMTVLSMNTSSQDHECEKDDKCVACKKDSLRSDKNKHSAQAIMIGITGPKNFILSDTLLWGFDTRCAADWFSPDTSAHTPEDIQLAMDVTADDQKCSFWSGNGALLVPHTCNGVGVTPTNTVGTPKTCWMQIPKYSGKVNVTYSFALAGQSYKMDNKGKGSCDFHLKGSDAKAKNVNLTVTVAGYANGGSYQVFQVDHPTVTLVKGDKKKNNCLSDFKFHRNAGVSGDAWPFLKDGKMSEILKSDDDDKNDDDCDNSVLQSPSITYSLASGTYTITATGTVSGLDGTVTTAQDFTGTETVTIGPNPAACNH